MARLYLITPTGLGSTGLGTGGYSLKEPHGPRLGLGFAFGLSRRATYGLALALALGLGSMLGKARLRHSLRSTSLRSNLRSRLLLQRSLV